MLAFASCCALAVPLEGHSAAQLSSARAQLSSAGDGPSMEKMPGGVLSKSVAEQQSLNADARAFITAKEAEADAPGQKCTLPTNDCKLNAEKKRALSPARSAPHGPR